MGENVAGIYGETSAQKLGGRVGTTITMKLYSVGKDSLLSTIDYSFMKCAFQAFGGVSVSTLLHSF